MSDEEIFQKETEFLKNKHQNLLLNLKKRRILQEESEKKKEFKTLMFGDYIVQVPTFHTTSHWSDQLPLPQSSASTYDSSVLRNAANENKVKIAGQKLIGKILLKKDICLKQQK